LFLHKKAAPWKGKEAASSKGGACMGKEPATSKRDIDDDDFMPSTKARKQIQPRTKELPSHSYPYYNCILILPVQNYVP
jgi:hypothetical protein